MVRDWKTRRLSRGYVAAFVAMLGVLALYVASSGAVTTVAACAVANPVNHLADSNFEIDAIIPPPANAKKNTLPTGGANLKKDGGTGCIDWGVVSDSKQPDSTTGSNDNSFGQGTSENDAVPTIVSDSIPPNKSDLLNFGVYEELAGTKTFVNLYWARINNPSGTTNMDFELNQNSCDPSKPQATTPPGNICSSNNVTPARRSGDKLVIFNLSSGGSVVDILRRTWDGSAWTGETALNSSQALGSINYDALTTAADNDGLGVLDSLTFGEVSVDFQALLGSGQTCGSFGSVYLKSRSSDSFSAEMKDFIAPKPITLTNCTAISTSATQSVTVGGSISDTATLTNANSPTGNATFDLYSNATCTTLVQGNIAGTAWSGSNGTYTSTATYASPAVGTYYWIAHYAGDANNSAANGACGDANETSTVTTASPSITTQSNETVTYGADIHDTATLSGAVQTSGSVGGSIEFKVYGPFTGADPTQDACSSGTLAATIAGSALSGPVSGNFTSTATYTPTAVGRYRWTASYTGDPKNNAVAETACIAAGELDTVNPAGSTITTAQTVYPNDAVGTITGTTGAVTFELYGPFATSGAVACTGSPAFTQTVTQAVGKTSNYPGGGGSPSPFAVTSANEGYYGWKVTAAADATHTSATSNCTETVFIDITN